MTSQQSLQPTPQNRTEPDLVQRLFNDGQVGPISEMECDIKKVNRILGVCLRVCPASYRQSPLTPEVPVSANEFYEKFAKNWLDRDRALSKAEVRDRGHGLDVLLSLEAPITITDKRERNAWASLIRVAQSILPVDPKQPLINDTCRMVGSVISDTGFEVTEIRRGTPITKHELVGLYIRMASRPFDTVLQVITDQKRLEPCPICKAEGSSLVADHECGFCDGRCGEVSLGQLYDLVIMSETNERSQSKGTLLAARFQKARRCVRNYWPTSAKPPRHERTRNIRPE